MDQSKLMKIGTVALIVIFAIEIVAFLFTQNPYQREIPSVAPSATPIPQSFQGINGTDAYVISIGRELLAVCNATSDPEAKVREIPGVADTSYDPQNLRVGIVVSQNFSIEDVASKTKKVLKEFCEPRVFKRAYVKVGSYLNLSSADGAGTSKVVTGSNLACLSQPGTYAQCFAFVQPETQANATIKMMVFVRMLGETIQFATAEEPRSVAPIEFKSANAKAVVLEVLGGAVMEVQIPWKSRNSISREEIIQKLNGTVNYTQVEYLPLIEITISNVTGNDTAAKINALSFVANVFEADTLVVKVNGNFTDDALLVSELERIGVEDWQYSLPDSGLTVAFDYSPENEKAILLAIKPFTGAIKRQLSVELTDIEAAQSALGGVLPQTTFEIFATGANATDAIDIKLDAILQDGEIGYISATPLEE